MLVGLNNITGLLNLIDHVEKIIWHKKMQEEKKRGTMGIRSVDKLSLIHI